MLHALVLKVVARPASVRGRERTTVVPPPALPLLLGRRRYLDMTLEIHDASRDTIRRHIGTDQIGDLIYLAQWKPLRHRQRQRDAPLELQLRRPPARVAEFDQMPILGMYLPATFSQWSANVYQNPTSTKTTNFFTLEGPWRYLQTS